MEVSKEGNIDLKHNGWQYLQKARCTSPKCAHFAGTHNCDPRVTGSIEHNMGRMILNSYSFEEIMNRVDELYEMANNCRNFDGKEWLKNWSRIEVRE